MKNVLILSLLFLPFISFSQLNEDLLLTGKSWQELKEPRPSFQFSPLLPLSFKISNVNNKTSLEVETSILCTKYQGKVPTAFFCRMEDKLEHKVRFPIRMRLGSLDYVDQLEQKHVDLITN